MTTIEKILQVVRLNNTQTTTPMNTFATSEYTLEAQQQSDENNSSHNTFTDQSIRRKQSIHEVEAPVNRNNSQNLNETFEEIENEYLLGTQSTQSKLNETSTTSLMIGQQHENQTQKPMDQNIDSAVPIFQSSTLKTTASGIADTYSAELHHDLSDSVQNLELKIGDEWIENRVKIPHKSHIYVGTSVFPMTFKRLRMGYSTGNQPSHIRVTTLLNDAESKGKQLRVYPLLVLRHRRT